MSPTAQRRCRVWGAQADRTARSAHAISCGRRVAPRGKRARLQTENQHERLLGRVFCLALLACARTNELFCIVTSTAPPYLLIGSDNKNGGIGLSSLLLSNSLKERHVSRQPLSAWSPLYARLWLSPTYKSSNRPFRRLPSSGGIGPES